MALMDKTSNPNSQFVAGISKQDLALLDERVRRVDERRWLASRYADTDDRRRLISLYAYFHELAKVKSTVSEPLLGAIRFQWWRDTLDKMRDDAVAPAHDVAGALFHTASGDPGLLVRCRQLVDAHETAFEEDHGPFSVLKAETDTACYCIAPDWTQQNPSVLRRLVAVELEIERVKVPEMVRPALAHFRPLHKQNQPGPIGQRLSIMLAVLTGRIV